MKYLLMCLLVLAITGCAKPKERRSSRAVGVSSASPKEGVETPIPTLNRDVRMNPYADYILQHEKDSRVVKCGEAFMLNDEMALTENGLPILFQGINEYDNIVYEYRSVSAVGNRKVFQPIILPATVSLLEGVPRRPGVVTGDAQVRQHSLYILSADNNECRYAVAHKKED